MAKYDLLTKTWTKETESGPIDRDGHTLTAYKVKIVKETFCYNCLMANIKS